MGETELNLLAGEIYEFTKILHIQITKDNNHLQLKGANTNTIFTPIGIHPFLVLLSQDPWFNSKPFFKVISRIGLDEAIACYKDIFCTFNALDDFSFANTSFLRHRTAIKEAFKKCLKNNYFSNITFMNFAAQEGANEIINAYVKDKTALKIKHFSGVKDSTNFTFLNTMHLQNQWADQFSPENTVSATFNVNTTKTIKVQMMRRKGQFYYKNDVSLGAKILKLPLANSSASLVIVVPRDIKKGICFNDLMSLTKDMIMEEIDVSLPKFKIEETMQLAPFLQKMGLQEVFNGVISGIAEDEMLGVREVEQKVFLDIKEDSLEMASGTLSTLVNILDEKMPPKNGLIIYECNITAEISNRYAKTDVVWRVNNANKTAQEAEFKVILSETAFISGFEMEIEGQTYKSYIKEKEQAKHIFNAAVSHGQSAGLVEVKTRDSTEFVVSVNLEPGSVAKFSLVHEELLQRVHDQYELVLNLCPGQIVDDLTVEVRINESQPLKFVKIPPFRSGHDLRTTDTQKIIDACSDIKMINSKSASVKFRPDSLAQKKIGHYLGKKAWEGLQGQFVVQYDVERESCNGEVLLKDGYFVHFFAPNDLDPLPKHAIFVLDTSSSMVGRKIEQLRDAMGNILNDLKNEDMLNILEFNNNVIIWDINSKKFTMLSEEMIRDFRTPFPYLQRHIMPGPQNVDDTTIKNAKEIVQGMAVYGRTFAIGGLETALYIAREGQKLNEGKQEKIQPIVIFLTDGEPNVGLSSKSLIIETVTQLNTEDKVPIFSLSFGDEADKGFLRKLSLKNSGFSRHIYEAADASLQLQDFYKRIASPLLRDINFKYDGEVADVTRTCFPFYFRGSELIVCGRYGGSLFPSVINCWGPHGLIKVNSSTERPVTSIERMWAYLGVKQLLEARETAVNSEEMTRRAISLALKYSFVTDVTSLVVVKPVDKMLTTTDYSTAYQPDHHCYPIPGNVSELRFGGPRGPLFGTTSTSQPGFGGSHRFAGVFGSTSSAGGVFGAAPSTGGVFGSAPSTGAVFGAAPSGVFGAAPSTGVVFGSAPSTGAAFGTAPSTAATAAPNTGVAFGSAPSTGAAFGTASSTGGLFGTTSATGFQFGNAPTSQPMFDTSQTTGSIFGTSSTFQSGFGSTQNTGSIFGTDSRLQPGFGVPQKTISIVPEVPVLPLPSETDKEFIANRPFIIMLQIEKGDTTLILCKGFINRPTN